MDVYDWLLALLGTFLLGMGKSGLKGLGAVIVTLMAIVFGGKESTGVLIPMMIAGSRFDLQPDISFRTKSQAMKDRISG